MTSNKTLEQAARQALEALETVTADVKTTPTAYEAQRQSIEALRQALEQAEQQKQEPEFFTHNVEQPHDWSEWVCPNPKGYLMKCCDCGLVHEVEFGVVRFKSETELEDCEPVNDPNLQAVFRMRRSEQWLPEDTAHRAGGLPMAQPEQEPVAWYDKHGMLTHDPFEGVTPLYTEPPRREWVGLTDEEVEEMTCHESLIRYFEAKLREKNA